MEQKEREFAEHFFNAKCGVLHMNWAVDAFWGLVCQKVILPSALTIYDELVKRKQTKPLHLNDGDDTVYYIKCKAKGRKVFVHTTQSRDYLYVIDGEEWRHSAGKYDPNMHIRRIWRPYKENDSGYTTKELIGTISKAIGKADVLSEWADDHNRFSTRPSIKLYKKFDFEIPNHTATEGKGPLDVTYLYGDFRDDGYILSYDGFLASHSGPRVEGSRLTMTEMEHISTVYLPCVADELGLKVPTLPGYSHG